MKAIISTNGDPKYMFFTPIVAWTWKKLGVETQFLLPKNAIHSPFMPAIKEAIFDIFLYNQMPYWSHFDTPTDNHEVTYTQVSRLFGCNELFKDDEVLVVSDIDMAVFERPRHYKEYDFTVFGYDLVPDGQYPMCYIMGTAAAWRKYFLKGRTMQQCLDDELAAENCENMRGNLWSRDQEIAYRTLNKASTALVARARPGTQYAVNRVDRDDVYWHEHLNPEAEGLFDAHLWRPGYTEENVEKIVALLKIKYPEETFEWLWRYAESFRKALKNG